MSALSLINAHGKSVRLERPTFTTDTGGGQVQAWSLVANTTVFFQPGGGSEDIRYGVENTRRFIKGHAPANCGIRDGDRIVWGTRIFDVQIHNLPGEKTTGPLARIPIDLEETKTDQ